MLVSPARYERRPASISAAAGSRGSSFIAAGATVRSTCRRKVGGSRAG